jgi:hypothetical protein
VRLLTAYFLAGVSMPGDRFWVNLSPYEKDRVIDDTLAKTDLGNAMLTQDYVLKQFMSSLSDPRSDEGKAYWKKLHERLAAELGTTDIPLDTFNKVWIVPGKTEIAECGASAAVTSARLRVMLEKDYQAAQGTAAADGNDASSKAQRIATDTVRERLLPFVEREVNEGKHFTGLRQMYRALVLATWFRQKTAKTWYAGYAGSAKTAGIETDKRGVKERIYAAYTEAFTKGVFDLRRKEQEPVSGRTVDRHYFSGGMTFSSSSLNDETDLSILSPESFADTVTQTAKGRLYVSVVPLGVELMRDGVRTIAPWGVVDAQSGTVVTPQDVREAQTAQKLLMVQPLPRKNAPWKKFTNAFSFGKTSEVLAAEALRADMESYIVFHESNGEQGQDHPVITLMLQAGGTAPKRNVPIVRKTIEMIPLWIQNQETQRFLHVMDNAQYFFRSSQGHIVFYISGQKLEVKISKDTIVFAHTAYDFAVDDEATFEFTIAEQSRRDLIVAHMSERMAKIGPLKDEQGKPLSPVLHTASALTNIVRRGMLVLGVVMPLSFSVYASNGSGAERRSNEWFIERVSAIVDNAYVRQFKADLEAVSRETSPERRLGLHIGILDGLLIAPTAGIDLTDLQMWVMSRIEWDIKNNPKARVSDFLALGLYRYADGAAPAITLRVREMLLAAAKTDSRIYDIITEGYMRGGRWFPALARGRASFEDPGWLLGLLADKNLDFEHVSYIFKRFSIAIDKNVFLDYNTALVSFGNALKSRKNIRSEEVSQTILLEQLYDHIAKMWLRSIEVDKKISDDLKVILSDLSKTSGNTSYDVWLDVIIKRLDTLSVKPPQKKGSSAMTQPTADSYGGIDFAHVKVAALALEGSAASFDDLPAFAGISYRVTPPKKIDAQGIAALVR